MTTTAQLNHDNVVCSTQALQQHEQPKHLHNTTSTTTATPSQQNHFYSTATFSADDYQQYTTTITLRRKQNYHNKTITSPITDHPWNITPIRQIL